MNIMEDKHINSSSTVSVLSPEQKQDYTDNGFLVIKDFVSTEICELLMARANQLIDNFDANSNKNIFSTKERDEAQTRNKYFIESGHQIRFFFEEGAFNEHGELKYEKSKSINKIGHALHELDPVFNCFSHMHKIAKLTDELGIKNPLLMQSMYICKQPHIGGEVNCHQDSTYLYTEGQPVIGLWFALEDATLENGCLWAIPGGHQGVLKNRMVRDQNGELRHNVYDETPWPLEQMIPLEVSRGSLVILHGHLPHMSKENRSARSRHAYSVHIISGDDHYPADNWLQYPADMQFKGFL